MQKQKGKRVENSWRWQIDAEEMTKCAQETNANKTHQINWIIMDGAAERLGVGMVGVRAEKEVVIIIIIIISPIAYSWGPENVSQSMINWNRTGLTFFKSLCHRFLQLVFVFIASTGWFRLNYLHFMIKICEVRFNGILQKRIYVL